MAVYSREVRHPPEQIAIAGRCTMGTFNGPIRTINLLELERPLGRRMPSGFNAFRLKEWQAFQLSNDDWFICLSVYNTKSVGIAIVMAYRKSEQRMYRYEHKVPYWQLQVPSGLHDSHCFYHSKNFSIDIHNHLDKDFFEVEVSAVSFKNRPDFNARWKIFHTTEPCVIVQPFAENRPLYSHKALMPVAGEVSFASHRSHFAINNSCAIVDDHKGFYPYVMKYDWVTALGFEKQGGLIGFNLTDNQIQDKERYNENCLWQNGKMIPLPPVTVKRPNGVEADWHIEDDYGLVELTFTPLADAPNHLNLGIAAFKYHGPTGRFTGHIVDSAGHKVLFDDFIGMGEQKYIRM
jgi:hypothetical protein